MVTGNLQQVGADGSLVLQLIFEFGPLWLVALAVPAFLYGPYWAGLVSAGVAGLMILTSVALTTSTSVIVMTITQIVLALLWWSPASTSPACCTMPDAVTSTIRSGVASGVGAISWMVFLPVALAFRPGHLPPWRAQVR